MGLFSGPAYVSGGLHSENFFISALEGALTHGLHRNDGTLGVLRANVGLAVGAQ